MIIRGILPDEFGRAWGALEPFFRNFEERSRGEVTAEELREFCAVGLKQCWAAVDGTRIHAVALTEVLENPLKTVLLDFCTGVGREDWRDMMVETIRDWARHMGAQRFRAICRPGWTKELKALGLRETHRVLEEDL